MKNGNPCDLFFALVFSPQNPEDALLQDERLLSKCQQSRKGHRAVPRKQFSKLQDELPVVHKRGEGGL